MHQEVSLIATVAVSFVCAAILGYLADRVRLPPLVGYLFAGIVMGPLTPGFVANAELASQLNLTKEFNRTTLLGIHASRQAWKEQPRLSSTTVSC